MRTTAVVWGSFLHEHCPAVICVDLDDLGLSATKPIDGSPCSISQTAEMSDAGVMQYYLARQNTLRQCYCTVVTGKSPGNLRRRGKSGIDGKHVD